MIEPFVEWPYQYFLGISPLSGHHHITIVISGGFYTYQSNSLGFGVSKKTCEGKAILALAGTTDDISNSTNEDDQPNTYFQVRILFLGFDKPEA